VAVCQFIPSVCVCVGTYLLETISWNDIPWHSLDRIGTHTHKHTQNILIYSHIPTLFITNVNQHSNSVT